MQGKSFTFKGDSFTFQYKGVTFSDVTLAKSVTEARKSDVHLAQRCTRYLKKWYANLRKCTVFCANSGQKRVTPRAMESVLRLARGITRARGKSTITHHELKMAIGYLELVYGRPGPGVTYEEVN